ncbi:methionine gamma-lyase [candidate division LCP-89 bacterium B3_LCP]|uniref:Methionine gamma-lyase n=1 Tax=candidate division LCP-89 bacterium B3_LCP TaxID=2012998 RepID=A0A532V0R3_UNCL8|nr:MAG: methionine gamma-lyase [candidate division LCP-89 bacterium B3_LCP]
MIKKSWGFATLAVHGSGGHDPLTGAISPPIYQSSTFAFNDSQHGADLFAGTAKGYIYSRILNPTQEALEREMAFLEKGEVALAFGSGMAAITVATMTLCNSGENFISSRTIYGGTHAMYLKVLPRLNIGVTEVDATDLNQIEDAIDEKTRFLFIETPANPTIEIIDIKGCAEIAHRKGIKLVVDNTFATPYLQQPLTMGADIVIHSATKYIGGHGDTVAGITVGPKTIMEEMRKGVAVDVGACISPFNAWLLLRGLKTLPVRMDRHCENATKVAQFLAFHPKVERVWFPGLRTHPQHDLAKAQMDNFGGMIAFEIRGGLEEGKRMMDAVELCTLAVSLGDCDTLIVHPASTTHSSYSPEDLEATGISPGMIRLSVGVEDIEDIIDDLSQALKKI